MAIDFAGPLCVKDIYHQDGPLHKCYIALFTYASKQVLHLEVVPDLISTFIRTLKCMLSHQGLSSLINVDNGSTFWDSFVQK